MLLISCNSKIANAWENENVGIELCKHCDLSTMGKPGSCPK